MATSPFIAFDFEMHRRALDCIAQGALTNSKRPESYVKGIYPTHVTEGLGCFLTDLKGKKYIDFICGLGTNLLGYANQTVTNAIVNQAKKGAVYSISSKLEIEVAEKIKQIIPFIDVMKFLKTGSEACSAALRIARAKSGRNTILSHGYHGWSDPFVSLTSPALGVPSHSDCMSNFTTTSQVTKDIAGVIIEPVLVDASDTRIQFLKDLRQKCTEVGALLIFDEVITGFRFPKFTASQFFGITPDIICLGKAIANGMPLSVVAGKKDVMNCGEYFVSSTFSGETLSLAAALETITLLQTKLRLSDLFDKANMFQESFNKICPELVTLQGYGTRGVFNGDILNKALFFQESCKAGILFGPSFFFNFCHIDLVDQVLSSVRDVLNRIKAGHVKLEGELPQSPFAQKMRG
jgi:glutamate-1-semialdehyde aminotransferase